MMIRGLAAGALIAIVMSGCASAPAVTAASGQVVDALGRPVNGARVTVRTQSQKPVGAGVTDADGRFAFALAPRHGAEADLTVEADGYVRWSYGADWKQLTGYRLSLDRKVDPAYLIALRAVSDPAERATRMAEILAAGEVHYAVEPLFPFLGELRQDLLNASAPPAQTRTDKLVVDRALELLAFLGDPRDRERLAPWLAANRWFDASPQPLTAPSLDALCTAWAAVHFANERLKQGEWPPHECTYAVLDFAQTRAMMLFQVDYAHWRYNMYLVFDRDGKDQPWQLRAVVMHETDDLIG